MRTDPMIFLLAAVLIGASSCVNEISEEDAGRVEAVGPDSVEVEEIAPESK